MANRTDPTRESDKTVGTITIASGLNVLIAIWLFASPWVLGYTDEAGWNATIVAVVIAVLAGIRLLGAYEASWLSWVNVILGAWLALSPWLLDYDDDDATWNSVIVGLAVAALAAWSASSSGPAYRRQV